MFLFLQNLFKNKQISIVECWLKATNKKIQSLFWIVVVIFQSILTLKGPQSSMIGREVRDAHSGIIKKCYQTGHMYASTGSFVHPGRYEQNPQIMGAIPQSQKMSRIISIIEIK